MIQAEALPRTPLRFGRYEVIERLGRGGMAEVYKARLRGVHGVEKLVALKRILPDALRDPKFVQLFVREARLTTRLQHPNLIQVFEFGQERSELYLAMELVEGSDLRKVLSAQFELGKRMPTEIALCIAHGVLQGLDHAHRLTDERGNLLNVVHRDLSPANVLLSYAGAVKVADFGVAHVDGPEKSDANLLKGKLAYMAPEQLKGQVVDARADVFAAACVLYELLAGEPVYGGKVTPALIRRVARGEVPQVRQSIPYIDPALAEVLQRALAPDRTQRTPSCERFDAELMALVHTGRLRIAREAELALYLQVLVPPAHAGQVAAPQVAAAPKTLNSPTPPPQPQAPPLFESLFDTGDLELPLEPPRPLDQDSIAMVPSKVVELEEEVDEALDAAEPEPEEMGSADIVGPVSGVREMSSFSALFRIPETPPEPARPAAIVRFTPAPLELGHVAVLPAWPVVEQNVVIDPPPRPRSRRAFRALLSVGLIAALALLAARWQDVSRLLHRAPAQSAAVALTPAPAVPVAEHAAAVGPALHLDTPQLKLELPTLPVAAPAAPPVRKVRRASKRKSAAALAADAAFQE